MLGSVIYGRETLRATQLMVTTRCRASRVHSQISGRLRRSGFAQSVYNLLIKTAIIYARLLWAHAACVEYRHLLHSCDSRSIPLFQYKIQFSACHGAQKAIISCARHVINGVTGIVRNKFSRVPYRIVPSNFFSIMHCALLRYQVLIEPTPRCWLNMSRYSCAYMTTQTCFQLKSFLFVCGLNCYTTYKWYKLFPQIRMFLRYRNQILYYCRRSSRSSYRLARY